MPRYLQGSQIGRDEGMEKHFSYFIIFSGWVGGLAGGPAGRSVCRSVGG